MGPWSLVCVTVLLYNVPGGVCLRLENWIVGGHNAHKGDWPWMVYLEMYVNNHKSTRCGGTLLTADWVMTAGHCWRETYGLEKSFARVGELSLEEPSGRVVKLKQVVTHPNFSIDNNQEMYYYDIALVQLQKEVSFSDTVKPVTLAGPKDAFDVNSECWVTGWGNIGENRPLGGKQTLQEVRLSLVDDVKCQQLYPHRTARQLCAGDLNGGKDACKGDSGGPLVCVPPGGEKKTFVQVGIVSFGRGCAKKDTAGVYTRVSSYRKFINDTIY